MEGITGAVAVVTGAAQGNGRAIALGLAGQGAKVIACDIQQEAVAKVAQEIVDAGGEAIGVALDITDRASCQAAAEATRAAFGAPASILINNAGIIRRTLPDSDTFEADWDAVMNVNATGQINMVQALRTQLIESKGRIVNLGSIMSVAANPGLVAYAASKGAVLQMTRALAHDLAEHGIRVNALAPGVIETPMTVATRDNPEAIGRFMAHTPMKRPGKPEELVGPVLFLASDASSYVTGALLPVDGGYLAA
ncbi:SDR family NAD(P)-dependent oxidoreductase [Celeribacter neptunius]|uniref:NAD(P)-dependent dehydrogenase, short-chain alcohol dehydrogenase family n=1 Tax=Celeribacter neptunius TaxID=588602 RepID=A0A1I3S3G0_9RHOB|nr:SDR family NAD(P)-dependent oxidoreductase [Celeribacter neptunius]SFJ53324.1 NAD(P)-dependent dehydrogenase, short-chain alcohol dehydrogenase family [Celeribacter neptunius]